MKRLLLVLFAGTVGLCAPAFAQDPAPKKQDPAPKKQKSADAVRAEALAKEVRRLQGVILALKGEHAAERHEWPQSAVYLAAAHEKQPLPERRDHALRALSRAWGTRILTGHSKAVTCLGFAPDGKTLASGSGDGVARLWINGKTVAKLKGHTKGISALAYSPDGKTLVTASHDNTLRVWAGGESRSELKGHTKDVLAVAFTPDGKQIVSAGKDGTLRLWAAADPKPLKPLEGHTKAIRALAIHPKGTHAASASDDGSARLWLLPAGTPGPVLAHGKKALRSVAFSPDGTKLATAGKDKTIRIWTLDGNPSGVLTGHRRTVTRVAWSSDGLLLASASEDGTVRLWSAQTNAALASLSDHADSVVDLAWSRDMALASASWDSAVGLAYPTRSGGGKEIVRLRGHSKDVITVRWSHDGRTLASGSKDGTIRLWTTELGQQLSVRLQDSAMHAVSGAPGGKSFVTATGTKIQLWDPSKPAPTKVLEGHEGQVLSVSYSRDGKFIASASEDKTLKVWEAESGKLLFTRKGHGGTVTSVSWAPDHTRIATSCIDKVVRVFSREKEGVLSELTHPESVWDVSWAPGGKRLATSGKDNVVRVWDVAAGVVLFKLEGHTANVHSLRWNKGGVLLASASDDGTVRLWQGSDGKALATLVGHSEPVRELSFHPDGVLLASAAWDRTIKVWDTKEAACVATLQGHTDFVEGQDASPVGRGTDPRLSGGAALDHRSAHGTQRGWPRAADDRPAIVEGLGVVAGGVLRGPALDQLKSWAGPEVEVEALGEEADWSEVEVRYPEGALRLRRLAPYERQFTQQLNGLTRFVLESQHPNAGVVALRLGQANTVIGFSASGSPPWQDLIRTLAQHLNGLVLHEARLLDHELRPLVVGAGEPDPQAALPALAEALERMQRSDRRLALFDLEPPPLPPLPSSEEVRLRSVSEVADRAQALWAVAARAEGLERKQAVDLLQGRGLWQLATPAEQNYLLEAEHSDEEQATYAHRKESLRVLLWAMEKWDLLGVPRHATELDELTSVLIRHNADSLRKNSCLRSASTLLDEACAMTRAHVMLELLSRAGRPAPKGLLPRVVAERQRALTWLLSTPRVEWDDLG
jgi:WD40 repeat protein